jgi:hypothetical protein
LEKLKKMAFGLKLFNKLVSLYPELLEKSSTDQTKKKITINLGPKGFNTVNVNKKRNSTQSKIQSNNSNR